MAKMDKNGSTSWFLLCSRSLARTSAFLCCPLYHAILHPLLMKFLCLTFLFEQHFCQWEFSLVCPSILSSFSTRSFSLPQTRARTLRNLSRLSHRDFLIKIRSKMWMSRCCEWCMWMVVYMWLCVCLYLYLLQVVSLSHSDNNEPVIGQKQDKKIRY